MKKFISTFVILIMVVQVFNNSIKAENSNISTVEQSMQVANDFIKEKLGINDYYSSAGAEGRKLNNTLAVNGTPKLSNMPIFVYGSNSDASSDAVNGAQHTEITKVDAQGNLQYRCLGYTLTGSLFANPAFPPDSLPGENCESRNGKWVKNPWYSNNWYIKQWLNGQQNKFIPDQVEVKTGHRDFFAANIQDGPKAANFGNGGSI